MATSTKDDPVAADRRDIQEMKDRLRRMETRLVNLIERLGFDAERKKPIWTWGEIEVPSMMVSLEDMIEAIPEQYPSVALVTVRHKGAEICLIGRRKP